MHPLGVIAGLGGSIVLHVIVAAVVVGMPVRREVAPQAPVEFEVQPEPPPPPPPPPAPPAPEPEPEKPPEPKRAAPPPPRAAAAPRAAVPRAAATPPAAAAPPVFGVDLTDTSPDGTVAAPVGNTTLTEPSRRGPLKPGPVAAAPPPPPPPPPPPVTIKDLPEVLSGPQMDAYPAECQDAERAGIEGVVTLTVVVLDSGRIGEVKLVKGIDRCLDAAALRLMREIKFKPAMGTDGKPQRYRIPAYRFRFRFNR
ncbi:MAG TPA: TonB family protein [Polyangia bacterium]